MDRTPNDPSAFSFDEIPNLLAMALGKPKPPDEFDKLIADNYGLRVWRWEIGSEHTD